MPRRTIALVVMSLMLLGACGTPQPTDAPPVAAPAGGSVAPTHTSLPPTATPLPPTDTPTPTPLRPTGTPTPTPRPPTGTPTPTPRPPTDTPTVTPTPTRIAESWYDGVRLTFVQNAGFLITAGRVRILIDVLLKGYPGGVLKPVLDGQPPFDGVELILATHEHGDHFYPELVLQYMQANPDTVFISTKAAVEQLVYLDHRVRPRTIPIELEKGESEQIDLEGLTLEAIYLSHGIPGILNVGFIVEIDGVRLLHTGDLNPDYVRVSDLQAYGLPGRQIDVALVPYFLLTTEEYHAHVVEGIQPGTVIPMHYSLASPLTISETVFPNAFLFQETYESWVVPTTDSTSP